MKKTQRTTITLCSSASCYARLVEVANSLSKRGFRVSVPLTANKMRASGNFDVASVKTWFNDPTTYKRKTFLTKHHFNKIVRGDSILVLNYPKNGVAGYIGGAVLCEMAIALHFKKKIYVLNPIDESSSYKEEILAMNPTILNGDLELIR